MDKIFTYQLVMPNFKFMDYSTSRLTVEDTDTTGTSQDRYVIQLNRTVATDKTEVIPHVPAYSMQKQWQDCWVPRGIPQQHPTALSHFTNSYDIRHAPSCLSTGHTGVLPHCWSYWQTRFRVKVFNCSDKMHIEKNTHMYTDGFNILILSVFVNNQLEAKFFFLYLSISILYMFRATKCSSSGESIVSIRPLVRRGKFQSKTQL